MILVTGATGNVGRPAVQRLVARGCPTRAAVRALPTADEPEGTEAVAFDFLDPQTWDAAERRGVAHVAFLSVPAAAHVPFLPHARVEAHLRKSGLSWTFLRAGFFMQNLLGPYRAALVDRDTLEAPAGEGRVAWVDTRDLGEAAAVALTEPAHRGRAWNLTGSEPLGFDDVAAHLTAILGRPIRYNSPWLPSWMRRLRAESMAWDQIGVMAAIHLAIRMGGEATVDSTLGEILGRPPRRIHDFIQDFRGCWEPR